MKWLGSRIGAALDDWPMTLLIGLVIGLSGIVFYADSLRTAFLWGVSAALAWFVMDVLFGVARRKERSKQTRR